MVRDDSKCAAKYRRLAREARRMADRASVHEQADLLEVEKRWLTLARNHEVQMRAPSQKPYPPRKRRAKA